MQHTDEKTARMPKKYYTFWILPLFIMFGIFYWYILKDLPSPLTLDNYNIPQTTKIYDRNDTLLFDIFVDQNRTLVLLDDIPDYVQQATIAIEDKDFYHHHGINPIGGIVRAAKEIIFNQRLQGGSTITQQLVKNALLTPERTIQRKIKEIIIAVIVEAIYSKEQILEMYLNQVPYGGTAWGIQAAAQTYFDKSVTQLTLPEAALLAGLPAAPTAYSPHGAQPELAKNRQREVLRRMVEDGYITKEEEQKAIETLLDFAKPTTNIRAPHFVMYIKQLLVDKYGERLVEQGGLRVKTTLDLDIQEFAEKSVATEVAKLRTSNVGNGAALVTKPATGEILVMVGSTDYFATESGNFNVVTARRQPGSSIKPINYAIGIELQKVTPASVFIDTPTCFAVAGQPNYCPVNYDGQFHGPVQLRFALGNSFNIPAVKMLYKNTVETMVASGSAFGINSYQDPSHYGLSLTLGGGEVQMTEMATAFGVFANGGIKKDLISILQVTNQEGKVLEEYTDPNLEKDIPSSLLINGPRVLSSETAFLISHILLDNNARMQAFGGDSLLRIPGHQAVSVKTGTTDDIRDNWTIGFTPQFLVATWVGNNDNTPMNQYLISGVSGAAPIWNRIMTKLLVDKPDIWPKQPEGVVGAHICTLTGKLPIRPEGDPERCETRFEYFIKGTVPQGAPIKQAILIDKATGKMAAPNQTDNVEPQEKTIITDGISTYCLDCSHDGEQPTIIR